ncbi:MAG TPA: PLP-dependent aminotransferase family protein [Geminicoccus sp.]|uniref:aminotransferase-like domain-containing protein n=1 Tax=Geminicoccus sp. TaxID=2024832 RepID=UPI002CD47058|nr:PLP-dependent aminotransferase family protein [Geminicoccus sp.]HWL67015.1 PLP-dependent aminotransferase family protein [Geminicoccus sp.]
MLRAAESRSRIEQVMAAVRRRIAGRRLGQGAKLPSIRGLATNMGVSPSTVVEAYERLAAEGLIRARPGAGFFVAGPSAPLALAELGPKLDRAIDPFWVSRQALDAGAAMLKPGCGWLPPDWLPEAALRRALRGEARAEPADLGDYAAPLGLAALRQHLARRLGLHGIEATPGQILLTESGTGAIDLVCRFLLEPGDAVLVDDPCYFNFLALLRAHRARVIGVPMTPAGPDLARFAEAIEAHRPRLYLTNSAIHNPTGASLSPVVAHRLLTLADAGGLTVVEDDIFGDLATGPVTRLAAFDGLRRVVQVGSFSKTLSAALRCGFIAARPDWIEGLVDLKLATSFSGGRLAEQVVLRLLLDGSYRRHLGGLHARLARARDLALRRLAELGIEPWLEPSAGMFLWCRLPDGRDAAAVARRALEEDVVLAPGNVFSIGQTAGSFLRFNVAQCADPQAFAVLARAMRAVG